MSSFVVVYRIYFLRYSTQSPLITYRPETDTMNFLKFEFETDLDTDSLVPLYQLTGLKTTYLLRNIISKRQKKPLD